MSRGLGDKLRAGNTVSRPPGELDGDEEAKREVEPGTQGTTSLRTIAVLNPGRFDPPSVDPLSVEIRVPGSLR